MRITTLNEARLLVGRTFDLCGERRTVRAVGLREYAHGVTLESPMIVITYETPVSKLGTADEFSKWMSSGATEVSE